VLIKVKVDPCLDLNFAGSRHKKTASRRTLRVAISVDRLTDLAAVGKLVEVASLAFTLIFFSFCLVLILFFRNDFSAVARNLYIWR
jgi:hypothetical protein